MTMLNSKSESLVGLATFRRKNDLSKFPPKRRRRATITNRSRPYDRPGMKGAGV
jgi:hypothetical protein